MFLLDTASIALGLIGWIVPVIMLVRKNKSLGKMAISLFISLSACACGLFIQIINIRYLVNGHHWSTLEDISGGIVMAASVLLIVTIVINSGMILSYCVNGKK